MPRGWGSEGGRATLASRNSNLGKRKLGGRGGGGRGGGRGGVARRRGDSAGDVEGNPGRVLDADADADDDLEFDADVDDSDDDEEEEEDGDSSDGDEYDDDDDDDLFGDDDDDDDGELDDSEEEDEPGNNNNAKAVAKNTSSADAFTRAFQKAEKLANKGKKKSESYANQTIQPQEDDILDASKVVARRRAEAKALKVSRSERRKEKLALKQQCRVYPTIKGEAPDEDAREKKLARLATRGVVRLFNAVRAAQKAEEGADVGKARAAKQGLVRSLEGTAVAPKVRSKAGGGGGGAATSSKWGVLSGAGVVENGKGMRMRQWDDTTLPSAEADVADDVAPPESLFD